MRELSAACTELADQLAVFDDNDVTSDRADAGLLTSTLLVVDQDAEPGTGRRSVPATRTPGNTQALNAEMDAHELVRRLEASLRLVVTGHTGRMRGGSDSSTRAAIAAIEKLGEAVSPHARQLAARLLDRATTTIGQLPSVDEIPRWEKIRPGPGGLPPKCPNCETYSLRVSLSAGVVVCVFPHCEDMDGRRPPQARMDLSKIDGRPVLVWRDGLVQLFTGGGMCNTATSRPSGTAPKTTYRTLRIFLREARRSPFLPQCVFFLSMSGYFHHRSVPFSPFTCGHATGPHPPASSMHHGQRSITQYPKRQ